MSKLPIISGCKCIKTLEMAGFKIERRKGSHIRLSRENPFAQTTVPDHDEFDRGTLRSILRQADLAVDEFLKLL
ncbi:MAG: type II toxin-antitoxin system HicA family toxin [Deltaproteobacteria bacterium]|nr:type II toxin-antitoxin system HicA family toxin [Deltaproteobacteria bacterium]